MANSKITWNDKVSLVTDPTIAEINKVTDSNMNEIKDVVNENADQVILSDTEPTANDNEIWIDTSENATYINSEISNEYGTATNRGYSQKYLNDLQPKVLWTNSNINVEFLAQDISITDLSTYSYYEIIYKQHATTQNYLQSSGKIAIGQNVYLGGGILRKSAAPRFWARFVDYSSTKLTFSAGYYETTSDSSAGTANDIIIPVQIIGYK